MIEPSNNQVVWKQRHHSKPDLRNQILVPSRRRRRSRTKRVEQSGDEDRGVEGNDNNEVMWRFRMLYTQDFVTSSKLLI